MTLSQLLDNTTSQELALFRAVAELEASERGNRSLVAMAEAARQRR